MRFSSEDEHVSIYGTPIQGGTSSLLLKTFTGIYGYVDENGQELVLRNPPGTLPYPCLSIQKIIKAFTDQQWRIESLRISHVQLVGNRLDFEKLASCIAQCNTLKSVILGDSRTSLLFDDDGSTVSGFDAIVCALSHAPQLQEVSLQNMGEISSEALGELCRSTSIEKLQLLLSQSILPSGGISGEYIRSMVERLRTNQTMKELRIFGVLDEDACRQISEMLLVNSTLQKIALKIKLQPQHQSIPNQVVDINSSPPPIFGALESPNCSLTSMELYLSGSRQDLEACADHFRDALQANQSLKHLNIIFFGLDFQGRRGPAAMRTNLLWMEKLEEALEYNYTLQQVIMNHGLLELSDKVKMFVHLNRAGRGALLRETQGDDARPRAASELNHWVETLARVQNDVSCLFYLISCAPTLFCGQRPHATPRKRRFSSKEEEMSSRARSC